MGIGPEGSRSCGEVLAETCQGFRNAVKSGKLSPEKALEKTKEARRTLMILEASGKGEIPFETGSTQLPLLMQDKIVNGKLFNDD